MSDDQVIPVGDRASRRRAMARGLRAGVAVAAVAAFIAPTSPAVAEPGGLAGARTVRVSVADGGGQGVESSVTPQISANGRYVAFFSTASNLVPGDTNDDWDVFVRDRQAGTTERVTVSSTGAEEDGAAHSMARISADGRYVAFPSYATNLVPGDTNDNSDVFVRDLLTGQTSRVSVSSAGAQADGFSAFSLALSPDGRYVLFDSDADNLVPGDTNGLRDIFLHDRRTGQTTRVSIASGGGQADHFSESPAISADGRYVAFDSFASNLVPGDTNGFSDVFVHDRRTGRTTLISRNPAGAPSLYNSFYPSLSADGRFVSFQSESPDVVAGDTNDKADVFVNDRRTGQTSRVSVSSTGVQADDHCNVSSISADGRYVVFSSEATTLVPQDGNGSEDVFVRDRARQTTTVASVATSGRQSNGWSSQPSISADGRVIAFASEADNLVAGDTNATLDVFVRIR
jgi:Tol biopolymer transport system component